MPFLVTPHIRPNGQCPYQEYIATLNVKDAAKVRRYVDRLGDHGHVFLAGMGWVKKINNVWELHPDPHRILFCNHLGVYVLLNGFRKKTRGTPRLEKERGERLCAEYIEMQQGGSHARRRA